MNSVESRDAQWRARTWRNVDRFQREQGERRALRLVVGTTKRDTSRRARLRLVDDRPREEP